MKKIYFLFSLIMLAIVSQGQQLLVEDFTYSGVLTANGWTAHSGAGTNALATTTGLTYTGFPGSGVGNAALVGNLGGEDANVTFTNQNTNGQDIYLSFLVNITDAAASKTGDYFMHIGSPGGATWTNFAARVFARIVSGNVNFGLSNTSTATWGTTNFAKNTTYLLIVKYTINTAGSDPTSLWVIPSGVPATEAAAGTPEVTNTTTAGTDAINAIGLRQGSNSTSTQTVVDGIRIGTTWTSVTGNAAPTPSLNASTLTGFGNVCINTTSGPNSFTITGTNLTTANVTVAALAGYSFSTTAGGTYTPTLSLTQPGGAFSQQIFVQFTPTAVQSYNGDIIVGGGGATAVNVAATGSGVNTLPTVTSGTASGITTSGAVVAGNISNNGCSAVNAYGIEYSLTPGFANGTGTQAASTNISAGAYTSSLSGLAPNTTYYYKAYATNGAGTSWGNELSFTTAGLAPTISATTLTGFGNVCSNTTAGPNSFTINGSNLTTANVVVGPLAGYTFSTTSGGTYTNSLTLTQTGGTYSQQVFVKFNPTAVQSYNGNIPVSGGGASGTTNVAATGAGVNTAPTVATGASGAVTTTGATLAGTISNTGCTSVTAYGIEYSTVNGFANGTGISAPSTNLSGTGFTSVVSGLAPSTTYYYKAFATNAGGTTYGTQQSFTTAAPPPAVLSATTLTGFGSVCPGDSTASKSFTITGNNLTNANITVGPLSGYRFSTTANGVYTNTLNLTQPGGSFSQVVYVKLFGAGVAPTVHNGNIPVSGGGAPSINVAATGSTIFVVPTVVSGVATDVTTTSATLHGQLTDSGCIDPTTVGFFYATTPNFPADYTNNVGTWVAANNGNPNFTYTLTGLVPNTTYYFKAFASSAAPGYGAELSFKTDALPNGFAVTPNPVKRGAALYFSKTDLKQRYFGIELYNSAGQQVFKKNFNVQNGFINDHIVIPTSLPVGVYYVRVINDTEVLEKRTIFVVN